MESRGPGGRTTGADGNVQTPIAWPPALSASAKKAMRRQGAMFPFRSGHFALAARPVAALTRAWPIW